MESSATQSPEESANEKTLQNDSKNSDEKSLFVISDGLTMIYYSFSLEEARKYVNKMVVSDRASIFNEGWHSRIGESQTDNGDYTYVYAWNPNQCCWREERYSSYRICPVQLLNSFEK